MTDKAIDKVGDMLIISGYNIDMSLYMSGCIKKLSISDFRKMLTVISHEVDPDDCLLCYRLWLFAIDCSDSISTSRSLKLKAIIHKKMDKLPVWVFEDSIYE